MMLVLRRTVLPMVAAALLPGPSPWVASPASASGAEPTAAAVAVAKSAFEAFDRRNLPLADALFSQTIDEWRRLDRGVEELTALLVARAGVRTDRTLFNDAIADFDEAIRLMDPTGQKPTGVAAYREYPDAFVQRGLAKEGLREWRGALADYDRAVQLWGGEGDGVNPFALSYRGRARAELGDFDGALVDFREASSIFSRVDKNDNQASAARANEAITLYGIGRRDEAVKIAKQVLAPNEAFTPTGHGFAKVGSAFAAWAPTLTPARSQARWCVVCPASPTCTSFSRRTTGPRASATPRSRSGTSLATTSRPDAPSIGTSTAGLRRCGGGRRRC